MYSFPKDNFGAFSEAEQSYAISQLDPFHDTPYRLEGAPSDANSDSVVMIYNQESTFSAGDFGLPTTEGEKFDIHFTLLPMVQAATFYSARLAAPTQLTTGGSSDESPFLTLYPVSVHAATTGGKTYVYDTGYPTVKGVNPNIGGFFSNSSSNIYVPRNMRVIGASFEVVDETPKFYQQGSCTVYSRPSCTVNRFLYTFTGTLASDTASTRALQSTCVAGPPNDIKQATILPNSRTWKSSEGAYVIGKCFSSDNDFERLSTNDIVFYNPNDPDTAFLKNAFVSREQANQIADATNVAFSDSFNRSTPYNLSGAYFTGLSGQYATLRLRTKLIYEILPDPTDTSLVTIATPTIPRDPEFEKLLMRTITLMPAGVQQTMNPKGELWNLVLRTAKKAGKEVLKNPVGAFKVANGLVQAANGNPAPLVGMVTMAANKKVQKAVKKAANEKNGKKKIKEVKTS